MAWSDRRAMGRDSGPPAQGEAQPAGRTAPGRRPQVLRGPAVGPLDRRTLERAAPGVRGQEHRPPAAGRVDGRRDPAEPLAGLPRPAQRAATGPLG